MNPGAKVGAAGPDGKPSPDWRVADGVAGDKLPG